ncbi:hypothetical protein M407DRAFT_220259 [Tulasnella calospora MUT 4182]|uniref:Uncharacterized protein n=1 Tax=Tulasnella calospora MUT 4182 TaxID=1051891 RepID=A0A0C3PYT9_9AGAM|nr:hypothetical protein M407DRAFT_220259 [Tulasnella calospora MUT 4182]
MVDKMRPEYLDNPNSAFGHLIRSLGRKRLLAPRLEVTGNRPGENVVRFRYAISDHVLQDDGRSTRSGEVSEWSRLESDPLTTLHAVHMIRVLLESGIRLESAALKSGKDEVLGHLLRPLGPVTRLILNGFPTSAILRQLREPFPIDPGSTGEILQFPCPNLTVLDLLILPWTPENTRWELSTVPYELRRLIQSRQTGTHPTAKLRKVGVPSTWLEDGRFRDPVFEGIEIYSVQDLDGHVRISTRDGIYIHQ